MSERYAAFWFRRDLRLDDNHGLFRALTSGDPVIPVFIFDRNILDELPRRDARVQFLHQALHEMQQHLAQLGSTLHVVYGKPMEVWDKLIQQYPINTVYTNHDYEPYAKARDGELAAFLEGKGIAFQTFQDQVIFEKESVLSNSDKPYSVFTPYSKKWRAQLTPDHFNPYDSEGQQANYWKHEAIAIPTLEEMGFEETAISFPSKVPDTDIIKVYEEKRNFPAQKGTTHIGIHLRFGTISVRRLGKIAQDLSFTYLNELIWREFYMQILWNFPHVAEGPFRPQYAAIPWRDSEADFEKWKTGQTGYPIVDAGMRELNETGYMHNRVRMITASFLTKHLLINWQWGEAYFAEKLLDFELSSNNGGWQWASGSGTDAAPYFRIFNPESQIKKFDPQMRYVRKWVPEYGTPAYAREMVNHKEARERCLTTYKKALDQS
ncbi:MAG: deoxyribodipyrimidine photo-lyase [Bacteroidota bacterium]